MDTWGPQPTLCGQTCAVSQATRQPALRLSPAQVQPCVLQPACSAISVSREKGNGLFIAFQGLAFGGGWTKLTLAYYTVINILHRASVIVPVQVKSSFTLYQPVVCPELKKKKINPLLREKFSLELV